MPLLDVPDKVTEIKETADNPAMPQVITVDAGPAQQCTVTFTAKCATARWDDERWATITPILSTPNSWGGWVVASWEMEDDATMTTTDLAQAVGTALAHVVDTQDFSGRWCGYITHTSQMALKHAAEGCAEIKAELRAMAALDAEMDA